MKHGHLIERLGPRSMSIHVPNSLGGNDIYTPSWRSLEVHPFLRVFDSLDISRRFDGFNRLTCGNWVKECRDIGKKIDVLAQPGLWRNMYDAEWLKQQPHHVIEDLRIIPHDYPLVHDETVLEYVDQQLSPNLSLTTHLTRLAAQYGHIKKRTDHPAK